jgi:hypothetical protein
MTELLIQHEDGRTMSGFDAVRYIMLSEKRKKEKQKNHGK